MKSDDPSTPTLSISLTPELLAAVDARVQGGHCTSASELIQEALRLWLQVEAVRQSGSPSPGAPGEAPADRLATTLDLFDFGSEIQAQKAGAAEPGLADEQIRARQLLAAEAIEGDAVIRPAPQRLLRLRFGAGSQ